ncbi:MAG TPA: hypothetical protein VMR52_10030 [Dehalococcoidia bacterium]|nr:hypothetical protein [Dehalococcoidia bacterium]
MGLDANEIPVAHTPEGGWHGEMPPPVLAGCDEPLAPGAPDLRGLWRAVSVERDGAPITDHPLNNHVERIEQGGDRVVIAAGGVIHDMRADGTLENGVNDVAAADMKQRIHVAAVFDGGRLDLYPMGYSPDREPLVTREIVDGRLVWHYGPFRVVMERAAER